MKFFISGLSLVFLILLNGCLSPSLSVQTEYLSHENLASYYVNTPDPALNTPTIGERLIISWSLPKDYLSFSDLHLHLTVRFHNREQEVKNILIDKAQGLYLYHILDEKFYETGGIQSYKTEVIGNGCILQQWSHPLWVELITFDFSDFNSCN